MLITHPGHLVRGFTSACCASYAVLCCARCESHASHAVQGPAGLDSDSPFDSTFTSSGHEQSSGEMGQDTFQWPQMPDLPASFGPIGTLAGPQGPHGPQDVWAPLAGVPQFRLSSSSEGSPNQMGQGQSTVSVSPHASLSAHTLF